MEMTKIHRLLNKGRLKAIVKEIAGRRMLIGFERLSKRSRKTRVKYFSKPIDLALLTAEHKRTVESNIKKEATQ